mmetsp:Transcript_20376/g.62775  ORF Transcript_20376/g.62775 Transcript_20376/m.62775 type:complete len:231 (-) Transcript_20376:134-826(-)
MRSPIFFSNACSAFLATSHSLRASAATTCPSRSISSSTNAASCFTTSANRCASRLTAATAGAAILAAYARSLSRPSASSTRTAPRSMRFSAEIAASSSAKTFSTLGFDSTRPSTTFTLMRTPSKSDTMRTTRKTTSSTITWNDTSCAPGSRGCDRGRWLRRGLRRDFRCILVSGREGPEEAPSVSRGATSRRASRDAASRRDSFARTPRQVLEGARCVSVAQRRRTGQTS